MTALSGNILVVDDNEMNRDVLSRRLAKKGHRVQVAEDGARALEMVGEADFDLILLDVMMPGIDGYEVLQRLREEYDASALPIIMATARSETENVVSALEMGANDYVTKPLDFPVVFARVQTQLALKKSREELARAHRRMKSDLEAAARIQQTLLPTETPTLEGALCAWRYVPCDELAGDTLNVVALDDRTLGLFVLDVSGHGVPSSLLSVTLSRLMSGARGVSSVLWREGPGEEAPRIATPAEVADELSRRFPHDETSRQYFTLVYGTLDTERRVFTYMSAGHPAVIHLRRGSDPLLHDSTGPPIALIAPILEPASVKESAIPLEPGDRLYLYSDGIPEAQRADGEFFGDARLVELLQSVRGDDLDAGITTVLDRVWEWTEGQGPDDDVSMVAVEIPDEPAG